MINLVAMAAAALAGLMLGGLYFGTLWWTVRRLPQVRHVWRWYFGALLLRLAVLLSSYWLVLLLGGWPALGSCLLGTIAARLALIGLLGRGRPDLTAGRAVG